MDDTSMFLLAVCMGVFFFLIAYPVARSYVAIMKKEKVKHPGLAYVLASFGAGIYGTAARDDKLEAKISPNLMRNISWIGAILLVVLLLLGYWKAWLYVAALAVAIFVAAIIVIRNQTGNNPVNKPKKQSSKQ